MLKRALKLLISLAVRGWDVLRGKRFSVVLYYHGVDASQRERFARQMDKLRRLAQSVRVTFDDGFVSVVENALPELESRNIPATLFIPTGSLGGDPTWMDGNNSTVLSAAQLAALKDRPLIAIGSHSVTHPDMTRLDAATAERELQKSKADLEGILSRRVALFSFPHGRYDSRLLELARDAGYERVFGIEPRPVSSDDEFLAGRVAVSPDDWPLEFKLKALGAYRWLAPRRRQEMTREEWDRLTENFADATLYQSWAYGAVHWREKQLDHFVVREAGEIIGLAQVRLIRFSLGLGGIAYVTRGPLWRRKDLPDDASRLERVLEALREEYCVRRGYYLRLAPQMFTSDIEPFQGFQRRGSSYRTLLIDLSVSVEQLRAGLRPSWRQCLNKAEAKGFEIVEGTDERLFDEVLAMQEQMHRRKQYAEFVNPAEFRRVQAMLPAGRKLQVLVCRKNGQTVAGVVWAAFGEMGLPLFGGTGDRALGDDASYALHWRLLLAMKERGLRYCDLGGINPDRNPGSYTFKTGMAKKAGKDVRLIGEFDACRSPISRAAFHAVMGTRECYRRFRLKLEERRQQPKPQPALAASRLDISIIIVNWNTRQLLAECLESIERTAVGLAHEVIVVDNHSSDGSQQMVRERFPRVRLIENEENIGFSRANNRGLEQAIGRYVCLVNSDIVVRDGCLQTLLEFMEKNPRVGLAGPRLMNADGSLQPSCRRFPTFVRHLARALFVNASLADPAGRGDVATDVEVLAGAFWMARREAIAEVGNLDEQFFMYGEDMDWCRRFWKAGWRVTFCPVARAVHYGSASSAADPIRCNIELQRARLQLWEKYHGQASTLAYLVVSAAHDAVRIFVSRNGRQHRDSLRWHLDATAARMRRGREEPGFPAIAARNSIRLGFAGDLFLGGKWISYATRHGLDILKPFEQVRGMLSELDILFVNLEGPLFANPQAALTKSVLLDNHPDVVGLLQTPRACVCNLANNHILDYGPASLERTQQRLREAGIHFVGAGTNAAEANREVIVDCRGQRIGCLGLTTDEPEVGSILARNGQAGCASLKDEATVMDRVRRLKANVDTAVVMLHWGCEFHEYPSADQVKFARALVDAGADYVVGQHAHFVQGFERYRRGTMFYSLGHFFVAPFRMTDGRTRYLKPPAREFALAICSVAGGREVAVEIVGGRWGHDCVLRPHLRAQQDKFTSKLRRLSEPLQSAGYDAFWSEYSQKRRRQLRRERISDGLGALKERLMNRELCR